MIANTSARCRTTSAVSPAIKGAKLSSFWELEFSSTVTVGSWFNGDVVVTLVFRLSPIHTFPDHTSGIVFPAELSSFQRLKRLLKTFLFGC